jgi:hypothetical protein
MRLGEELVCAPKATKRLACNPSDPRDTLDQTCGTSRDFEAFVFDTLSTSKLIGPEETVEDPGSQH